MAGIIQKEAKQKDDKDHLILKELFNTLKCSRQLISIFSLNRFSGLYSALYRYKMVMLLVFCLTTLSSSKKSITSPVLFKIGFIGDSLYSKSRSLLSTGLLSCL